MIGTVTKAGHGHIVMVGYDAERVMYVAYVITVKRTKLVENGDLMELRKEVDGMVAPDAASLVVNCFRQFSQNLRGQCRAVMQQTRLYIKASRVPREARAAKNAAAKRKGPKKGPFGRPLKPEATAKKKRAA